MTEDLSQSPASEPSRSGSLISRRVSDRYARPDAIRRSRGPMLRLTRQQRDLLRAGLIELCELFEDQSLWTVAADEAERAEQELGIDDLAPGFVMWSTNMAALARGSWWLLMPGCGAPLLQATICRHLDAPFLDRRPDYDALRDAVEAGRYPTIARILEWTERVRCMLAVHVR